MNAQRITMAGWGDASTAATMSTADDSLPMEVTIEQHLCYQRSFRQEPKSKSRKHLPTDAEDDDDDDEELVGEETPKHNNNKSGRLVIVVLAVLVVLCAATAVGLHFYNQSISDNEQDRSVAAIEGGDATENNTNAPSLVNMQSPTVSPMQEPVATIYPTQTPSTTSPTIMTTESPTFEAIVVDNPLWTNAPSVSPTQRTSAPFSDFTINTPLTPSSAPMETTTPSLRRPSVAPSAFPTTVSTTVATNRQATINPTVAPVAPTVSPTITTTIPTNATEEGHSLAPTGAPSVRSSEVPTEEPTVDTSSLPTEEPTVDTSSVPTSKPSLRASSAPTTMPTVAPTTLPPSTTPTLESSELPTTLPPTESPTMNTPAPTTASPTSQPTRAITSPPTSTEFSRVVIEPDGRLDRGDYVFSPNGRYRVGLTEIGDLQLVDTTTNELIWNANITGGHRCYLQGDGQCIVRDENGRGLWSTKTSKNHGSQLVLDNGGMLGILYNGSYLWIQGVPRGIYDDASNGVPSANDIQFPVRGAFYYPWYPETWKAGGQQAIFEPDAPLGYYNSADPAVVDAHLDHFEYGNIELGIMSWWGKSKNNDRARISLIQNMTLARGSNIKWTVYYEEMDKIKSLDQVKKDLAYMKKWYTWHDTWAKVDGKPVIFVYHNRGCQNTERWMEAANGKWHVVLKLFGGFEECPVQPSSWHNYGPAREVLYYEGHSFSISPGFWHAAEPAPRLPRVNQTRWCEMVQDMVDSQAPWQLITTFNEAGEGTMIEPSASWASDSGYGYYLDCLHQIT